MISQKKVLCNRLLRNCSKKVIDVLKLNRTLQNILYCYVIIVINYNTNNIHISYQSRLQDKPFFSYVEFVKTLEKFQGGHNHQTPPLVAPLTILTVLAIGGNQRELGRGLAHPPKVETLLEILFVVFIIICWLF
jgi:hypothetical protein